MNRHPPQALDAEERALAAQLPRAHGRSEPGPDLDARILAAAQAAIQARPARPPPRRSWIGPTAVAASLMLAVGLAWQLRPPPSLPATSAESAASTADAAAAAAIISPPPAPADASLPQARPQAAMPAPAAPPLPARDTAAADTAEQPRFVAAPPPAPPAPPAPVVADTFHPAAAASEQLAEPAPAMAKAARNNGLARERTTATGAAAAQAPAEAARAAEAATLDSIVVAQEAPDEDVPPATADSPQVRDAWLRRIGELLKQGKTEDAEASLGEFRRRYPDAVLPPELRTLEH